MRRRQKPSPIRNKLDLSDRVQVRLLRKRLHLSEPELTQIVGRIGNSIAAISKEASLQRTNRLPEGMGVPSPEVIASVTATEKTTAEPLSSEPNR
ncbi:DUF3606 domain-containing protein [Bradyrhizobium sp. USDA 10063]